MKEWIEKTKPYHFKVLFGITAAYTGLILTTDINTWIKITLILFNPYVWYGLIMMWVNREQIIQAYELMEAFWIVRKHEKEEKKKERITKSLDRR